MTSSLQTTYASDRVLRVARLRYGGRGSLAGALPRLLRSAAGSGPDEGRQGQAAQELPAFLEGGRS